VLAGVRVVVLRNDAARRYPRIVDAEAIGVIGVGVLVFEHVREVESVVADDEPNLNSLQVAIRAPIEVESEQDGHFARHGGPNRLVEAKSVAIASAINVTGGAERELLRVGRPGVGIIPVLVFVAGKDRGLATARGVEPSRDALDLVIYARAQEVEIKSRKASPIEPGIDGVDVGGEVTVVSTKRLSGERIVDGRAAQAGLSSATAQRAIRQCRVVAYPARSADRLAAHAWRALGGEVALDAGAAAVTVAASVLVADRVRRGVRVAATPVVPPTPALPPTPPLPPRNSG
jgi:hypothetical protein